MKPPVEVGQLYADKDSRMTGRHVSVYRIEGLYAYCSPCTPVGKVLSERLSRISLTNLQTRFTLVGVETKQ